MSDDFLTILREPPRREFADGLYRKLSQLTESRAVPFGMVTAKRLALALAILVLAFGGLFALSPEVRAQVGEAIKRIGGISYKETDQVAPMTLSAVTIQGKNVSLDEARSLVPYDLKVPTWVPSGFVMEKDLQIVTKEDLPMKRVSNWSVPVTMVWRDRDNRAIVLTEQLASGVGPIQVGKESVQEVKINGQPGALIGGMWDGASGTWRYPNMLSLMWLDERLVYKLYSSSSVISVGDLIRMAESLR